MKSPFPGMDPYLERHWGDVHISLITYIRDELQPRLPKGLLARGQESVRFEEFDQDGNILSKGPRIPDVAVVEKRARPLGESNSSTVVLTPPIVLQLEFPTERWIEIIDIRSGGRVVTAIEVLSPNNKQPVRGFHDYNARRENYVSGGVNFVEIDLLRSGRRNLLAPVDHQELQEAPYYVCVFRASTAQAGFYPISLRNALFDIPVPMRESDGDVMLPLQMVLNKAYEGGAYAYDIDYTKPLTPPLSDADRQWVDKLLDSRHS